jgi:hypothetical protein
VQCSLWYDAPSKLPVDGLAGLADHRPTNHWLYHTTSCITQSNAPEDGQNCCTKYIEIIWIYQLTVVAASSWFSSLPSILMMHGQTNIKLFAII